MNLIDVVGWAGAAALLVGYGLLTRGTITAASALYLALNLGGSAALLLNGAAHAAWPSVGVNALWLAIGAFGFVQHRQQRTSARVDLASTDQPVG